MFCSNCGTQIADNARFCKHCGASISAPAPISQPVPVIPYAPAPEPVPVVVPTVVIVPETTPVPVAVPEAIPTPVVAPEEPVAPVKKKKKKLLPLFLILALVAVAAVAAVFLFGKQTVYLATETVSTIMNGPTTTTRYEYDDAGRITKYEYAMVYPDYSYSYDVTYEVSYEYDSKGNLVSAEFESDGETIEIEYLYEDNVLVGFEADSLKDSGMELKVKCDDNGNFKSVAFLDEEGEAYRSWEFKYHENGTVKESRFYSGYTEMVSRFNEDGQNTETALYADDELMHRVVYDYDKEGRQTKMKQYDGEDELAMQWELEYTFKKDQLTGMTMQIKTRDDDGDMIEAEITFECQWDGLECEVTIDEVDGDEEAVDQVGFAEEDAQICFEVDKDGNLINMEIIIDGEVMNSTTNEYEAFKVSRRYKKVNVRNDPLYLLFLLNR